MTIHPIRAAERHLRMNPLDRGIIHRARLAIVADIFYQGWRAGWAAHERNTPPTNTPPTPAPQEQTPPDYAI